MSLMAKAAHEDVEMVSGKLLLSICPSIRSNLKFNFPDRVLEDGRHRILTDYPANVGVEGAANRYDVLS